LYNRIVTGSTIVFGFRTCWQCPTQRSNLMAVAFQHYIRQLVPDGSALQREAMSDLMALAYPHGIESPGAPARPRTVRRPLQSAIEGVEGAQMSTGTSAETSLASPIVQSSQTIRGETRLRLLARPARCWAGRGWSWRFMPRGGLSAAIWSMGRASSREDLRGAGVNPAD
jgi:hypothetical protein